MRMTMAMHDLVSITHAVCEKTNLEYIIYLPRAARLSVRIL